MRSVWLCSRNDAIGNLAVMAAALGVFGTGSGWLDLAVAVVMSTLALTAARSVIQQAGSSFDPRRHTREEGTGMSDAAPPC